MIERRILVDARLPWGSGIGRYVRNIVPGVAARLPATGLTLLVSPANKAQAAAAMAPCPTVTVRASGVRPFSLAEQWSFPALAQGHDLTWFTNYWVPLRWPGRFVATVHDLIHLDPDFPTTAIRRFAAARAFAKVRRDAAHVVFVSDVTARAFVAKVGTPRAASTIHHGIDHDGDHGGVATPAGQPRSRTALVVAAAKEHKNLPLLLDAWERAAPDGWRLVVVGPGDDIRSSIDLSAQAARIPAVEFRRGIANAELAALYADAGFVLIPSRYEGFGLPLLEAMRAGAPVVSSTAAALVEIAGDAPILFVDPDDREGWVRAIRAMATECGPSNARQTAITERSQAHALRFTWDRAADRTAAVLAAAMQ